MYVDKNNTLVRENDILLFNNGSMYMLTMFDGVMCLKNTEQQMPLIKADMITLDGCFASAMIYKKLL